MRRKNRVLLILAGISILAVAWAAFLVFGGWKLLGSSFEDDASLAAPITQIQVAPAGLATVDIRTTAPSQVHIHRTVRFLFRDRPDMTYRIEGTTLYLDQCDGFCAVDYQVDAPQGVDVSR